MDTKNNNLSNKDGIIDYDLIKEIVNKEKVVINPLGDWEGGEDVDAGCTNRKLGSDQPLSQPNGLREKTYQKQMLVYQYI